MKKVVAILVNDVHLNKDNGTLIKSIFKQLVKICKDNGTDNIICGGDVFTSRSGQPLSCLTDWKDVLKLLTKNKIKFHVIPGNHDKTDKDSEKSYLEVFSENCQFLYRNATNVDIRGVYFTFIPFFGDIRWLEEFNSLKFDFSRPNVLITHMGFDGVRNNDGSEVESTIKPSMFKKFTNVLIGHYHNASKLAKNVHYTGSAYQNNYGETISDKGCTLIYEDGSIQQHPLKFPKYIKEVVDVNDSESLRELIEKYEGNETDNIRFVFRGKKVDANKVDISFLASKGIDAKFEAIEVEEAIQLSEDEGIVCYDKKVLAKDFLKFCSENSIKGKHLKYGMDLIKSL